MHLRHLLFQGESTDSKFSFWDWYFNAIEMIDDRNAKLLPTRMATTDPSKKEWRTMAGLFRAGLVTLRVIKLIIIKHKRLVSFMVLSDEKKLRIFFAIFHPMRC
jgi:hypothetical protein